MNHNNNTDNLHISFGPVQDFVSSARKTRDSWAGSYLLAYLAGKVLAKAEDIAEEKGYENPIVIPNVKGDKFYEAVKGDFTPTKGDNASRIGTIPNFMEIKLNDDDYETTAKQLIDAWYDAWCKIEDGVWDFVKSVFEDNTDDKDSIDNIIKIWERQVEQAWYHSWVYGTGEDIAIRKNLRNFPSTGLKKDGDDLTKLAPEPGEKCTVCGKREVLHKNETDKYVDVKKQWKKIAKELKTALKNCGAKDSTAIKQDGSERLCAICLIKRLFPIIRKKKSKNYEPNNFIIKWQTVENYPSTPTMAVRDWLIEIARLGKDGDLLSLFQEHLKLGSVKKDKLDEWAMLKEGSEDFKESTCIDGDYLFYETLERMKREKQINEEEFQDIKKSLDKIYEKGKELNIKKPNRFYAVLAMDGDNMGKTFSKLNTKQKQGLSGKLREFATKVPDIIEKKHKFKDKDNNKEVEVYYGGITIYAGGDDVVAFLPTTHAINTAEEIKDKFNIKMRKFFNDKRLEKLDMEKKDIPTISASIIFAPYLHPLRNLMDRAQTNLNKKAKDKGDRNAISIEVIKSGGPTYDVVKNWEWKSYKVKNDNGYIKDIIDIAKDIQTNKIPSGFIFKFDDYEDVFKSILNKSSKKNKKIKDVFDILLAQFIKTRSDKVDIDQARLYTNKVLKLCLTEKKGALRFDTQPLMLARFLSQNCYLEDRK